MDAVEKRVSDRIALERRQLHDTQMALGRRKQTLEKDADRGMAALARLLDALKEGKTPTKAVAEAGERALKTLGKITRQMGSVNDLSAQNAAKLAKLDDSKERDRRVKEARELGADERPLTGLEAAELVLVRRGRATHVATLTKAVLESGVVRLTGKTPEQTMSAYLAKAVGRPDSKFVRVAPGVFDLKERAEEKPKRKRTPKPEEVVPVA